MGEAPSVARQLLVFTDLDGSLLDPISYSWDAARQALAALEERDIPLVLVSSKTRAEIESLRIELKHRHPFITENGGAVFIPRDYFSWTPPEALTRDGFEVIELGTPYESLRHAIREIEQAVGVHLRGFRDMTVEEVATRTGLPLGDAEMAMEREYDEPFLIDGPASMVPAVQREARERGLSVTRGGRFHHLLGGSDKGRACLHLLDRYRRQWQNPPRAVTSIGLGDSTNDLPMLKVVDIPVAIQHADGSYDPGIQVSNLVQAPGVGPVGWNAAVLDLLRNPPGVPPRKRTSARRRSGSAPSP